MDKGNKVDPRERYVLDLMAITGDTDAHLLNYIKQHLAMGFSERSTAIKAMRYLGLTHPLESDEVE